MTLPIAITGLGVLSPYGDGLAEICTRPRSPVARFAMVDGPDGARFVSPRLRRKLDRFTVLGLCAAGEALEASGLLASGVALDRVGIFVGNCLGGWGFTEPELRRLHTQGVGAMGPYVATAWFPAAVQGQISLAHGIKGHSKTFSHDVGGVTAIGQAMRAIAAGRIEAALCGATESLDSDYVRAVLAVEPQTRFAEGAAFLTLERLDRALDRGAPIHALIAGYAETFSPDGRASAVSLAGEASPFGRMFALSGVLETVCAAWSVGRGDLAAPWDALSGGATVQTAGRSGSLASLDVSPLESLMGKEKPPCLVTCG